MWFIKFIVFIPVFIFIGFIINMIIQSIKKKKLKQNSIQQTRKKKRKKSNAQRVCNIKESGSIRQRYSKIINSVLESHPDCKIFKQNDTSIVVGAEGIAGSQMFYITETFEELIIQMKVKNNPLLGNMEREWKFPKNMNQYLILEKMCMDINKDMEIKLKNLNEYKL